MPIEKNPQSRDRFSAGQREVSSPRPLRSPRGNLSFASASLAVASILTISRCPFGCLTVYIDRQTGRQMGLRRSV
jgi:hypothetical protein